MKPKNMEQLKKVAEVKSEESNPVGGSKKVLAKKDSARAKMLGLLDSLRKFMEEEDEEEMEDEKNKKSSPTFKSGK